MLTKTKNIILIASTLPLLFGLAYGIRSKYRTSKILSNRIYDLHSFDPNDIIEISYHSSNSIKLSKNNSQLDILSIHNSPRQEITYPNFKTQIKEFYLY